MAVELVTPPWDLRLAGVRSDRAVPEYLSVAEALQLSGVDGCALGQT